MSNSGDAEDDSHDQFAGKPVRVRSKDSSVARRRQMQPSSSHSHVLVAPLDVLRISCRTCFVRSLFAAAARPEGVFPAAVVFSGASADRFATWRLLRFFSSASVDRFATRRLLRFFSSSSADRFAT
eukprot:COSAG03_NODE_2222_length_2989_cov_8.953633_1_plen_125_part_10